MDFSSFFRVQTAGIMAETYALKYQSFNLIAKVQKYTTRQEQKSNIREKNGGSVFFRFAAVISCSRQ